MLIVIRPLYRAATYKGFAHALLGMGVWLSAQPGALVLGIVLIPLLGLDGPDSRAALAFYVGLVVLQVVLVGLSAPMRRAEVRAANVLLDAGLPVPAGGFTPSSWSARARSLAWVLVSSVLGAATVAFAGFALMFCLLSFFMTFDDEVVSYLGVELTPGWGLVLAVAHPLAAVYLTAGVTALLRLLARPLLGPSAAERLVAAEREATVLAERNRLARELHDSIGHTLTASTIQAALADRLMDGDPETARRALRSIEESSRTALEDLDHVLGMLRDGASSKEPNGVLADVPALVDRVRGGGREVRAELAGDFARVPAAVSREAYRIVQEGLTNAMRHAPGAPVDVRVAVDGDALEVFVVNPVPVASTADGGRRGLSGVRERVRLLRGEVTAGAADGEWILSARLPL